MSTIADRYRLLAGRFTSVAERLDTEGWQAMTPCEGWTPRDVVEHIVTTQVDFINNVGITHEELKLSDPVTAWPVVRDLVQVTLDDSTLAATPHEGFFGPSTFEESLDNFYSFDLSRRCGP